MKQKIIKNNIIISFGIILIFLSFANFIWFSNSLNKLTNFNYNASIMLLVNLCLGPLILFLAYKKNKIDLTIIVLIQICGFLIGAHSIYLQHPSYVVFSHNSFKLINTNYSKLQDEIRFNELKSGLLSKPLIAYSELPNDFQESIELMLSVDLKGAPDIHQRLDYYKPYKTNFKKISKKSLNPEYIFKEEHSLKELNSFIKKFGGVVDSYLYLPLESHKKRVIWVFDRLTAKPLGIIDIDPWPTVSHVK